MTRPPRYAPAPVRCGSAPAHTYLTPGLRCPVRLASSSCGRHEYSWCMRQTSDRRQTSSDAHHHLMSPTRRGGGHNNAAIGTGIDCMIIFTMPPAQSLLSLDIQIASLVRLLFTESSFIGGSLTFTQDVGQGTHSVRYFKLLVLTIQKVSNVACMHITKCNIRDNCMQLPGTSTNKCQSNPVNLKICWKQMSAGLCMRYIQLNLIISYIPFNRLTKLDGTRPQRPSLNVP